MKTYTQMFEEWARMRPAKEQENGVRDMLFMAFMAGCAAQKCEMERQAEEELRKDPNWRWDAIADGC